MSGGIQFVSMNQTVAHPILNRTYFRISLPNFLGMFKHEHINESIWNLKFEFPVDDSQSQARSWVDESTERKGKRSTEVLASIEGCRSEEKKIEQKSRVVGERRA